MFYFSSRLFFLSFLFGGILCFVPLFNIVGYESAAISGVVVSILSLFALAQNLKQERIEANSYSSLVIFWLQSLSLLAPTLGVLALNGLRVETCAWGEGFFFWLLIPPVSMVLVQSLWMLGIRIHHRFGWGMVLVSVLCEVSLFLWRLANEPPIARYEWLIGWFSGSIYDEALSVPTTLIIYRIYCLLCALLFVQLSMLQYHRRHILSVVSLGVVLLGLRNNGAEWMSMHTHASVQKELGGRLETEHSIVYFSRTALSVKEQELLAKDIEFRYEELQRFFQEDPVQWKGRKMEIYVYPSSDVQQRLMGSRRTFVARPWTHQMHLRWTEIGDSVLAHEMAHLFTAPFASWPFRLASKGGVGVDMGLVEGIAVAADWSPDELNPHYASAALRAMDKAPNLRDLFAPTGFWSQPSGKAYTMMGSFVRWLIEEYGIASWKKLYRGSGFTEAYGIPVEDLISQWELFLDGLPLDERAKSIASHRYARRSIFEKVCARSLSETKRRAEKAEHEEEYELANQLYREVLEREPDNPKTRYAMSGLLISQHRYDEAEAWIDASLSKEIGDTYKAAFQEHKGDIAWHRGQIEAAREIYLSCLEFGLSDARRRNIVAKIQGVETKAMKEYLLEQNSRAKALFIVMDWVRREDSAMAKYLVGLQLMSLVEQEAAIEFLEASKLEHEEMDGQRLLLLGKAYSLTGNTSKSQQIWNELAQSKLVRLRMEAQEWMNRDGVW